MTRYAFRAVRISWLLAGAWTLYLVTIIIATGGK